MNTKPAAPDNWSFRQIAASIEENSQKILRLLSVISDVDSASATMITPLPSEPMINVDLISSKLGLLLTLIPRKIESEDRIRLPVAWLRGLEQHLNSIQNIQREMINILTNISNSGAQSNFEPATFQIISSIGSFDFNNSLAQLANLTDAAISICYDLNMFISEKTDSQTAKRVPNLTSFFNEFVRTASQSNSLQNELTKLLSDYRNKKSEIFSQVAEIENTTRIAQESSANIQEFRSRIMSFLAELEQFQRKAIALDQTILQNQAKFNEFDASLEKRNQEFQKSSEELSQLVISLKTCDEDATKIIRDAKDALQWATAQGLAQGFSEEAKAIDAPIVNAIRWVYGSIAFLLASIIAFIIFPNQIGVSLPPFFAATSTEFGVNLVQSFVALSSRILVLLPAIILFLFCQRRYRELFILREQYLFKKAIATAIPGFKENMANSGDKEEVRAITAAAFDRLLYNPREATARDLVGDRRSGFLSRWLERIVRRALDSPRDG